VDKQLTKLSKKHIYFGTSSWKYEGWKGSVYKNNYKSDKAFKEDCLKEYAEHFTTAGVDHTYYTWPVESTFKKYISQTPDELKFGLKVTERVTIFKYPNLRRYGKYAGKLNEDFLEPKVFKERFLKPLKPFKKRLGPIMLEFSQFYPGMLSSGGEFVDELDQFFKALKKETDYQFAVEMRNKNWLQAPYFEMLAHHKVAHVFNSWTRMPSIGEQLELAKDYSPPCYTSRVLLKPGKTYQDAVKDFSPYDKTIEKQPQVRNDVVKLIHQAIKSAVPAYVFVNNRCEGSAPNMIDGILKMLAKK